MMAVWLAVQKEKDGRLYYTFEFASKASNYIRHALAIVTVGNGKQAPMKLPCLRRCQFSKPARPCIRMLL